MGKMLYLVCWMLIVNGLLIVDGGKISQSPPDSWLSDLQPDPPEVLTDTQSALVKWKDLKARLLKLNPEFVQDDDSEDGVVAHERHLRTLFPAGYSGCSCSDLAAIAAQITLFEDEVGGLNDLESKLALIATAIKQLGAWVESGVRGPRGPEGIRGPPGITGRQGDTGDVGTDTVMTREGVPGPQGPGGPTGSRGIKGIPGDCIKGQKGTQGKKGEAGIGTPGPRGQSGPRGVPGAPAPVLDFANKKN